MELKISEITSRLKKAGYKKIDITTRFQDINLEKVYYKTNAGLYIQATTGFWFAVMNKKGMFRGDNRYHYGDKYNDTGTNSAISFLNELNKILDM